MGRLAKNYGSERHFLEYRRAQSPALDSAVIAALNLADYGELEWVYPANAGIAEREPEGVGFLRESAEASAAQATQAWKDFWPQRGTSHCWDGVARLHVSGQPTSWLLFEAKANHVEFVGAPCKASPKSREKIERALAATKKRFGAHRHFDWTGSYYQHANRLAAVAFLEKHRVAARLVEVFFTGDHFPDGRECPASQADWERLIEARRLTLGLGASGSDRVAVPVFLPALAL